MKLIVNRLMKIYFPHIYRKFTAGIRILLGFLPSVALFLLIGFNYISAHPKTQDNKKARNLTQNTSILGMQTAKSKREIDYWNGIIKNYPGYNYAFLKLATLYYKEGNQEKGDKYYSSYKEEIKLSVTPLPSQYPVF